MRLQALGCSAGFGTGGQTTSLLWEDDVLIDAGTGVSVLPFDGLLKIDHAFVSHAHLDHVAGLVFVIDAGMRRRPRPLTVHGLPVTLDALRRHIFNGTIWPDVTRLPSADVPAARFTPMVEGETVDLGSRLVTALPTTHTVPSVGYLLSDGDSAVAYSGDTTVCEDFWSAIQVVPRLKAVILEMSYDDNQVALAPLAGHLCPSMAAPLIRQLPPAVAVYLIHLKPADEEAVRHAAPTIDPSREVSVLSMGQLLTL